MLCFAQLVMRKAEVVGASHQVHSRFQRSQTTSSVTAFARQARKPFAHRPIQAFNKGALENRSSMGGQQEPAGLIQ